MADDGTHVQTVLSGLAARSGSWLPSYKSGQTEKSPDLFGVDSEKVWTFGDVGLENVQAHLYAGEEARR